MEDIKETYTYNLVDKFAMEDIEERRLFLDEEINSETVTSIIYHIMRYNKQDSEIPIEKRKPIKLFINSVGGSVSDGFGLIDAILTSKTPVYTINQAMCASMAFLIFIAGAKRLTMPHSEFLMHDGSTFTYGSTSKVKDRIEFEAVQLEKEIKDLVLTTTKISNDLYDEKYRTEWYFLPREAKEIGVVDSVIGTDCSIEILF